MSSRHTRRKRSRQAQQRKLEGMAQAERSRQIAKVVRENKSKPIERNYYPSSNMGRLAEMSHRGYVAGGITRSLEGSISRQGGKRKFVPKR